MASPRSPHGSPPDDRPRAPARSRIVIGTGSEALARAPTTALPAPGPLSRGEPPRPEFGPVKRFGDYTLVKKLATGGMAEIWLARRTGIAGFCRFVVVKKILPHLAEQETFVRMFQDEARTSALLSHPNIVQIHELGQAENTYFIAMEYIGGENLAAIAWRGMKRGRPFPPSFAARVLADAAKALHYAHDLEAIDGRPLGIVHRDVSPQNILVTYDGEVKVVDFGIAKAASKSEVTKTGMLKGKFSYMSPEQCLGAEVDRRSDIFALGILLYELCTGKRLYKHESELMILDMITKRSVIPPSQVSPNIPSSLEDIILRALEKDADARFQTAQEMQLALESHLRSSPVRAGHPEVAAYMQAMFADKIEEKRRLRERASRDDFEAAFLDEERTSGLPSVAARSLPSVAAPTGGLGSFSSQGFTPAPPSRLGQVLTALSLGLVVVSITVLVALLGRDRATPVVLETSPPKPLLTGAMTLESSPSQAVILLDGQPMRLGDGSEARTPSDLKGLQYGRIYEIVLRKEGYRPHVLEVPMGEAWDGKTVHPQLEPFPGRLLTEVEGADAGSVTVRYDGDAVGAGPRVVREMPGNGTVLVEAEREGWSCRAEPSRVRVLPNQTVTAVVRCHPVLVRKPAAPRSAPSPRPAPSRPASERPSANASCATHPELPEGFVTIDTRPHSKIFWGKRELGETPLPSRRLPAGCVELRAVAADGSSRTVKIEVEPNMNRTYRFDI